MESRFFKPQFLQSDNNIDHTAFLGFASLSQSLQNNNRVDVHGRKYVFGPTQLI